MILLKNNLYQAFALTICVPNFVEIDQKLIFSLAQSLLNEKCLSLSLSKRSSLTRHNNRPTSTRVEGSYKFKCLTSKTGRSSLSPELSDRKLLSHQRHFRLHKIDYTSRRPPPSFTINFIYSHRAHSHIQCLNNRETGCL